MSREIKFRAWSIEKNLMSKWIILGDEIVIFPDSSVITIKEVYHKIGIELMQFTGLKDKNGKEIYEGDILEITLINIHLDLVTEKAFIKWNVWNWSLFRGNKYYDNCSQILLNSRSPEVIGNIFENPELLKS